jgi:hypothetical protein
MPLLRSLWFWLVCFYKYAAPTALLVRVPLDQFGEGGFRMVGDVAAQPFNCFAQHGSEADCEASLLQRWAVDAASWNSSARIERVSAAR